jgi:hypothetical protein
MKWDSCEETGVGHKAQGLWLRTYLVSEAPEP